MGLPLRTPTSSEAAPRAGERPTRTRLGTILTLSSSALAALGLTSPAAATPVDTAAKARTPHAPHIARHQELRQDLIVFGAITLPEDDERTALRIAQEQIHSSITLADIESGKVVFYRDTAEGREILNTKKLWGTFGVLVSTTLQLGAAPIAKPQRTASAPASTPAASPASLVQHQPPLLQAAPAEAAPRVSTLRIPDQASNTNESTTFLARRSRNREQAANVLQATMENRYAEYRLTSTYQRRFGKELELLLQDPDIAGMPVKEFENKVLRPLRQKITTEMVKAMSGKQFYEFFGAKPSYPRLLTVMGIKAGGIERENLHFLQEAAPDSTGQLTTVHALIKRSVAEAVTAIEASGDYRFTTAQRNQLVPLVITVLWEESRGDASAVSREFATGYMQEIRGNCKRAGVNPFNPAENIQLGTRELLEDYARYQGNLDLTLTAYNQGAGAVDTARRAARATGSHYKDHLTAEGRNYASNTHKNAADLVRRWKQDIVDTKSRLAEAEKMPTPGTLPRNLALQLDQQIAHLLAIAEFTGMRPADIASLQKLQIRAQTAEAVAPRAPVTVVAAVPTAPAALHDAAFRAETAQQTAAQAVPGNTISPNTVARNDNRTATEQRAYEKQAQIQSLLQVVRGKSEAEQREIWLALSVEQRRKLFQALQNQAEVRAA